MYVCVYGVAYLLYNVVTLRHMMRLYVVEEEVRYVLSVLDENE